MALNNLGMDLQGLQRFEEAINAHARAAKAYRDLADHNREAGALNNLAAAQSKMQQNGS